MRCSWAIVWDSGAGKQQMICTPFILVLVLEQVMEFHCQEFVIATDV